MNLSVAFAALLTGVVIWALLVRRLQVRTWEVQGAPAERTAGTEETPPAKVCLWIFLAVVTSLFGLFASAYYMRMAHGHGGGVDHHQDWSTVPEPRVLWINTALLILSSIALQWSRSDIALGRADLTRVGLAAGGALAIAFLAGQAFAWNELASSGFVPRGDPAAAFFYVLTAVHGLHLLGGLYVLGRATWRLWRPGTELIDIRLSVELCTVYWHYLLLVWIALFTLLLAT
jgi:cytochrome c oxidase subunit III